MPDRVTGIVATTKDIFGLLREIAIVVAIGAFLLAPTKINAVLKEAGFTSASIAGLEWRNQLVESAETNKQAQDKIQALEKQLADIQTNLTSLSQQSADAKVKEQAKTITENVEVARQAATGTRSALTTRIEKQAQFLDRVDPGVVRANPKIFTQTLPRGQ